MIALSAVNLMRILLTSGGRAPSSTGGAETATEWRTNGSNLPTSGSRLLFPKDPPHGRCRAWPPLGVRNRTRCAAQPPPNRVLEVNGHRSCNGLEARIDRGDRSMKYLLTGVAVVAVLAFSTPGWTQANPSGGNAMGMPGPNPGGPGLTPYSSSPRPTPPAPPPSGYTQPSTPPSAYTPSSTPPSGYSSATPPKHRPYRHYSHGKMAGHYQKGGKYQVSGSSANQLNQGELARLQAGNYSNPPAPPYQPAPPGPGTMPPPKQY